MWGPAPRTPGLTRPFHTFIRGSRNSQSLLETSEVGGASREQMDGWVCQMGP